MNFCKHIPIPSPLHRFLGEKRHKFRRQGLIRLCSSLKSLHRCPQLTKFAPVLHRDSATTRFCTFFFNQMARPNKKKQLKNKHCDSLRPTTPDILQESDWSTSPTYRAFHTAIQDGLTNSFANTTFRSTITCNKHPSATFNPSSLLISLIPSHISFSFSFSFSCCSGHPCWRWLCADVADMTHISSLSMSKSPISPIILTISNL